MFCLLFLLTLALSFDLNSGYNQFHEDDGEEIRSSRSKRSGLQYNYDKKSDHGPLHWADYWKDCQGNRQSPVNLVTKNAKFCLFWITLNGITNPFRGKFVNNGHAPTFELRERGSIMTGLPYFKYDKFELVQFHFHFGHSRYTGTEHSIDGKRYAVERPSGEEQIGLHMTGDLSIQVHLVHYNIKYGSLKNAINKVDGLAVLAVLMEEREHRPTPFDDFMERLGRSLVHPEGKGAPCSFNPFEIVPKARTFYYYRGSLTTPGCYQSVNWVVFRKHLYIRPKTLAIFRTMETSYHHEHISDMGNLRPVQPLNHRKVLRNFVMNV